MKHHNLPWTLYFRYMSLENLPLFVLRVSFAFCLIGAVSVLKVFVTAYQKRCKARSRPNDVTYVQTVLVGVRSGTVG